MTDTEGDPGAGIHPLAPLPETVATRRVDPLLFCPKCTMNDQVESAPEDYVTFTETDERARAAICTRCRIMWTETTPSGKRIEADTDGGSKRRTISIPGAPVRPYSDPKLDPRLISTAIREDPRIRTRKVELRRDIARYEGCRVARHDGCRCQEIERKWQRVFQDA